MKKITKGLLWSMLAPACLLPTGVPSEGQEAERKAAFRSPCAVAVAPKGDRIYVSDRGAGSVHVVDLGAGFPRREIPCSGEPAELCLSPDGSRLYVAERGASSVAVFDTARGDCVGRIPTDRWPVSLALDAAGERLFVGCEDTHVVLAFDLRSPAPKLLRRIPVLREPSSIAVTPDGSRIVVANRLPHGRGTDPDLAASVTLLDGRSLDLVAHVPLPPGSSGLQGVCSSPDGRWGYAVHGLGRFKLPMTQLERGWVNTYALSIVDLAAGTRKATVLLDDLMRGAADPFGVACSADGRHLWISHAGVHEVSKIDVGTLHELLAGKIPDRLAPAKGGYAPGIWSRIKKDPRAAAELSDELSALGEAGLIRRFPSGGLIPRGLKLSPDGKDLFVAHWGSGMVSRIATSGGSPPEIIALGPVQEPDATRRGEILFHDATRSFQSWHSCATCHPNDGRVDGLRWDFVDDGLGNGMDTLVLRYIHETGRLHRLGTLKDDSDAARHGLTFTHMIVPSDGQVADLQAYLRSLKSEASPHAGAADQLLRGKGLFEGKADCARCHSGPRATDLKFWNVLEAGGEEAGIRYKTTSLVELHRSGPYLHDGRALTIEEILTTFNPQDRHGRTRGMTPVELADLAAYLRSL